METSKEGGKFFDIICWFSDGLLFGWLGRHPGRTHQTIQAPGAGVLTGSAGIPRQAFAQRWRQEEARPLRWGRVQCECPPLPTHALTAHKRTRNTHFHSNVYVCKICYPWISHFSHDNKMQTFALCGGFVPSPTPNTNTPGFIFDLGGISKPQGGVNLRGVYIWVG